MASSQCWIKLNNSSFMKEQFCCVAADGDSRGEWGSHIAVSNYFSDYLCITIYHNARRSSCGYVPLRVQSSFTCQEIDAVPFTINSLVDVSPALLPSAADGNYNPTQRISCRVQRCLR